jgi:hypothetical protein
MKRGTQLKTGAFAFLITLGLFAVIFTGCGGEQAETTVTDEEPVTAEPETVELSDTIVLPEGWEMTDAMSISEIETLVGTVGYDTWYEPLNDAAAGKPQASYYDTTRPEDGSQNRSKINFLVYTFDGGSNFDRVSSFVHDSVEVPGDLWDRAIIGTMGGDIDPLTVATLIQRGDVCIRIKWEQTSYPEFNNIDFSVKLAEQLINNLYGGERNL